MGEITGNISQKQSISGKAVQNIPVSGKVTIGTKPVRELWFSPRDDFPAYGLETVLYTDTEGGVIYYWSGTAYVPVSGNATANIIAKSTSEWAESTDVLSKASWLYIYTDYRQEDGVNVPAIKLGDGHAFVVDLPFFTTGVTETDRQRWDNKVAAKMSDVDIENLILYKD